MNWAGGKPGRQASNRARSIWSADLTEAARAGGTARIACRQEDHRALREEAGRIGAAEACEVAVDVSTPRLVAVRFTRKVG